MKQKVVSIAIIRKDNKILLLRRKGGRPSISGMYELPRGKLHSDHQPEDALRAGLMNHLGVEPATVILRDAVSYVDPDDRLLQYTFIVYDVSITTSKAIRLDADYDKYVWKKMSEIQRDTLTQSTLVLLGIIQNDPDLKEVMLKENTSDTSKLVIYSDGGSRGNPGPSAAGFVVMNTSNEVITQGGAFLGFATNSLAEYYGVQMGLQKALELGAKIVDFRSDSTLVVNQMKGIYKLKDRELWPVYQSVMELIPKFEKVSFTHVKREFNTLADGVVSSILNNHVPSKV